MDKNMIYKFSFSVSGEVSDISKVGKLSPLREDHISEEGYFHDDASPR
jgi:hypothetical protein